MFRHDCPLAVESASTPWSLLPKQTWRYSLPTDILLSAVSILVVALLSSEVPEGLWNYPVDCVVVVLRYCGFTFSFFLKCTPGVSPLGVLQ
jgi:hypothetical protein